MEEELKNIEQPVETQNLASPDQPAQEIHEVQPVQPPKQDTRKRYPWYYVKRFDRYIIKNFLGTFLFAILLLFAIVVVFDIKEKLDELRSFSDIGDGTISVDVTEDIDWINNWKQYFHKFFIDDILVIPSWEKESTDDKEKASMVLHIDPGTAFGTGMHETTQLCIRMLKKYVTPDTELLDVGTGSGVLSILALMFGAKHAVGTDLDKCAVPAVKENMENNGIEPSKFDMMIGNIIDDKEVQDKVGYDRYDIVVANILANVLVPLTPVILSQLKSGGIYITSGIINTKEEEVKKAHLDAGLEILEIHHQGDWVSITSRKN